MHTRCISDLFGYCGGKPQLDKLEEEWSVTPSIENNMTGVLTKTITYCILWPCKKFITASKELKIK